MGMPLDYIQGLNSNDVNRSNAMTNIANVIGDIEHKRGITSHNTATLAADTAYKTRVNEINTEKAKWEALKDQAVANKDYVLMKAAERKLKDADLESAKLASEIGENRAQASASYSSNVHERLYDDPKTGKKMVGEFRGGRLVNILREANRKDREGGDGGSKRPWDSDVAVTGYVNTLTKTTDKDGNVIVNPRKRLDLIKFDTARDQVAKEGKILIRTELGEDKVEVPIVLNPGEKLTNLKVIRALMDAYNMTEEEATELYLEDKAMKGRRKK